MGRMLARGTPVRDNGDQARRSVFGSLKNRFSSKARSTTQLRVAIQVFKRFFDLPVEEKERLYSEDRNLSYGVKTSVDFPKEKFHFWKDTLRHPSHPQEDHLHHWPENPDRYSHMEVLGPYSMEMRDLGLQILDLICEGLGLENGYFGGGLSEGHLIVINHYPSCPDPTLVLGLPKHGDPHLITLFDQGDVPRLQVWKDEEWVTVEPIPNAFVVNINYYMLHVPFSCFP